MVKRQMELSLGQTVNSGKPSQRDSMHSKAQERRQSRGHWWFARMRQVVDDALDRQPNPIGSPALPYRENADLISAGRKVFPRK
jgi:hypothetical protein